MALVDNEENALKVVALQLEQEKAAHAKTKEQLEESLKKLSVAEEELKELEADLPALRSAAAKSSDLELRYATLQKEVTQKTTSDHVRQQLELECSDISISLAQTVCLQGCSESGHLNKKGTKKNSFKRRFCVLKDGYLFDYKTDGVTETRCKFFRLSGCRVVIVAEAAFHFQLESPLRDAKGKPRHIYELKADGKAPYLSWLEKIRAEIASLAATRVGLMGGTVAGADKLSLDKALLETRADALSPGREEQQFKLGERVHVKGYGDATVKYYGYITNKMGQWVGVEFDQPIGKNSGKDPEGKRHFECKKMHGLFTRQSECTPATGAKSPRGDPPKSPRGAAKSAESV